MSSNNSNSSNNKFRLRGFGNGDVLVTTVLFGGMFGYCLFVCLETNVVFTNIRGVVLWKHYYKDYRSNNRFLLFSLLPRKLLLHYSCCDSSEEL